MNEYAVIKQVNGNFVIHSEHGDISSAEISFANLWAALVNASEEVDAVIKVVDRNLDTVNGDIKKIQHPAKNA